MRRITIIILALFTFSILNAQVNNNNSTNLPKDLDPYINYHVNGILAKGNFTHLLDSMVIFENSFSQKKTTYNISYALHSINSIKSETIIKNVVYDYTSPNPFRSSEKTEVAYNYNSVLSTITKSEYDNFTSTWELKNMEEFEYQNSYLGRLIKVLEFEWIQNKQRWEYTKKTAYKYTSFNEVAEISECVWNDIDLKWDSSTVISNEYDISNRLISITDYGFNANDNSRFVYKLFKNTYDSSNLICKNEHYEMYNPTTDNFDYTYINDYTYYSNKMMKECIGTFHIYQNLMKYKDSYTYDIVNDITTRVNSSYDTISNAWFTNGKNVSYYNLPTRTDYNTNYRFDTTSNQWINDNRTIKKYDKDGNLESNKNYYFDLNQNKWLLDNSRLLTHDQNIYFRYTYVPISIINEHYNLGYNIENAPIISEYFNVKYNNDSINPTYSTGYHYSNNQLTSLNELKNSSFKIFPNPTNDFINIRTDNTSTLTILKLYNTLGVEVFNTIFRNNFRLDISGFSKGLYSCLLIEGDKIYNKKIIIQ